METSDDEHAIRSSAQRLYAEGQVIWHEADAWNVHKRACIDQFCSQAVAGQLFSRSLDIGAGRHPYDWMPNQTIHTDRFHEQVRHHSMSVVADAEALPFADKTFDLVVCVGAVLNYVSAIECIAEISRVMSPGGRLLLHFESSTSAEQLGNEKWGASAARLSTINAGRPDNIWIYRPRFVFQQLLALRLRVLRRRSFHIASAIGLRLGFSQTVAARLVAWDWALQPFKLLADDVILLAERT